MCRVRRKSSFCRAANNRDRPHPEAGLFSYISPTLIPKSGLIIHDFVTISEYNEYKVIKPVYFLSVSEKNSIFVGKL